MGVDFREFQGIYRDPYYLQHHGILGMKWGVRRYQNKDGSLTVRGRARLAKIASNPFLIRKENRQAKRILKSNVRGAKISSKIQDIKAEIKLKKTRTFKEKGLTSKAIKSEEEYREAVENAKEYLQKVSVMNKKISDINNKKIQAGKDFLIQKDWNIQPNVNIRTKSIIPVNYKKDDIIRKNTYFGGK